MTARTAMLCAAAAWIAAAAHAASAPSFEAMAAMRDGANLATDVYLPATGAGPWPAVFCRTPYGKRSGSESLMLPSAAIADLLAKGIAVAIQDVRGRGASQGEALAFVCDGWGGLQDGKDTVDWLRGQAWCDGRLVSVGASANGMTQVLLAGAAPAGIQGQIIALAPISSYHYMAYTGGEFRFEMVDGWLAGAGWPYLQNKNLIRSHPTYDAFWQTQNLGEPGRVENIDWPVVVVAGWYDLFLQGSIDLYRAIRERGGPNARDAVRLLVGPYTHTGFGQATQGEASFPNAQIPYGTLWPREMEFIDRWLLGAPMPTQAAPVAYYAMGDLEAAPGGAPGNEWRAAEDWPPPAKPRRFHLDFGNRLSEAAPASQGSASYTYNPFNYVPTRGGQNFFVDAGPFDQTASSGRSNLESRADVVLFTSEPLIRPLEAAGRVKASVVVSTLAADTDFTAKLTDVYPNGKSMLIADGIQRLLLRDSLSAASPVAAGQTYRIEIDMGSTCAIFNAGHRIRLAVSSSNYPRFQTNPNNGSLDWTNLIVRTAANTVHWGGSRDSYLELPIPERQTAARPAWTNY